MSKSTTEANRKRGNSTCAKEVPFDASQELAEREERKAQYVSISEIDETEDGNPRKITRANLDRLKQSIQDNRSFFEARPVLLNRLGGGIKDYRRSSAIKGCKGAWYE